MAAITYHVVVRDGLEGVWTWTGAGGTRERAVEGAGGVAAGGRGRQTTRRATARRLVGMAVTVGVLALQGAYLEHANVLRRLSEPPRVVEVKRARA